MTNCPLCAGEREVQFRAMVLERFPASYWYCSACGLLQTEKPYWLDEAYGSAIVTVDTGLVQRNLHLSRVLSSLLYFHFKRDGRYLDIAGGYGLLTRLMRDIGFDYYWSDPYCENLFARGFTEKDGEIPYTAITAFEVLEHVHDPLTFLEQSLSKYGTRTVIFSTELYEGVPPRPEDWWYYALKTGQHISFYRLGTLKFLANSFGLHLQSHGGIHMMTDMPCFPGIFRVVTGRLSGTLSGYVRRRMRSRTFSDFENLIRS